MLRFIQPFFKFQFLIILISILAGIYYPQILDTIKWSFKDAFLFNESGTSTATNAKSSSKTTESIAQNNGKTSTTNTAKETLFTKEELWKYNGADNEADIYISILGSIFDVTRGRKHYGAGCAYNMFAGRDASASFVTGNFEKYDENSDDVVNMELSQIWDLDNWRIFYHKEYTYKGKLIGRFYNENGKKTKYHLQVDELILLAKQEKEEIEKEKGKFPQCNIEWAEETGTRVWCTKTSGGTERNWIGVPRKYFDEPKKLKEFRCACVKEEFLDSPKLREYDNCDPKAKECFYRID